LSEMGTTQELRPEKFTLIAVRIIGEASPAWSRDSMAS
jgi:hypothetical protein